MLDTAQRVNTISAQKNFIWTPPYSVNLLQSYANASLPESERTETKSDTDLFAQDDQNPIN